MSVSLLRVDGATIIRRLSEFSDHQKLHDGLNELGLGKLCPEPISPLSRVSEALRRACGVAGKMIRPLKSGWGYCVLSEEKGDEFNTTDWVLCARITEDNPRPGLTGPSSVVYTSQWRDLEQKIMDEWERTSNLVHSASLGRKFAQIVCNPKDLDGIHFFDCGPVYWLPEPKLDRFAKVAKVIEDASIHKAGGTASKVVILRTGLDPESILSLKAGLIERVKKQLGDIDDDVMNGDLGARALNNRADEAKLLLETVKMYESIFSSGIDSSSLADLQEIKSQIGAQAEFVLEKAYMVASAKSVVADSAAAS